MYFPKVASTEITEGDVMKADGSGHVTPSDSSSGEIIVGVARQNVDSSDSSNDKIAIEVPLERHVQWEADCDTGHAAADADVLAAFDLTSSGDKVDLSATSDKVFLVTGIVSDYKVIGELVNTNTQANL